MEIPRSVGRLRNVLRREEHVISCGVRLRRPQPALAFTSASVTVVLSYPIEYTNASRAVAAGVLNRSGGRGLGPCCRPPSG